MQHVLALAILAIAVEVGAYLGILFLGALAGAADDRGDFFAVALWVDVTLHVVVGAAIAVFWALDTLGVQ